MLLIFLVFFVLSYYVSLRSEFRIKTMFCSSLPPVVCRRDHVLFTLFVFVWYSGVQHVLCFVFALFFFVVWFQFLWIVHILMAPSVFSNVYWIN